MPPLLRPNLHCHYCGKKSNRKWDSTVGSWRCPDCEAINHLDKNGQITDPPVSSRPKEASPQYGRYARRTQSPDLSPQGNDIFCKQCVTNQHFVQQNLAEYLPEPSDPDYPNFLKNFENYKKDLEVRYPQVCATCAPRVNERLKATTYAAKADHLRRGLEKRKPSSLAPDWQKWGWRRFVVFVGGILWWASVLGQVTWHILGVLPPTKEQLRLRNTSWYGQWTCAANAMLSQEKQMSCLEATKATAWRALWIGVMSFWWNNRLSQKLSSRERRLGGLGSYLIVQLISLSVRATALFALEHQDWIPTGVPANGIHGAMLVFLVFGTLISLATVKLSAPRRPNLTNHHPVQVDPAAVRPAYQPPTPVASQTMSFSTSFPISALSRPTQPTALTPSSTQQSYVEEDIANEMDWTPTGPSQYTQFSPEHVREYRRPDGPNPFRGTLPPAPKPPAHKVHNPKPFIPASQDRKNNFMKEIRGEIRAATGTPSDDEDEGWGFGGRKKSNAGIVLAPSNMRDYQAESAEATGLENLFNSAFTIKEDPLAKKEKENEYARHEEKGFVMDGETVRENFIVMRTLAGLCALLVVVFGVAIAMGWFDPKATVGGLLYEKATLEEVHEVVEDFVQDYLDT